MPVIACTMKTASVSLPSVCHQVRPPGILRSSSPLRIPMRSMRSSTHLERRFSMLRFDPIGNAEAVVLVVHEHRTVSNLYLQFVEWTGRRTGKDFARLHIELPAMTRAEKMLQLFVEQVAAADVRA